MIEKLILNNYVPLLAKGTRYVELGLDDIVNIFMGRNGFGKSSILKQCMLGVPESRHFEEGGYRYMRYRDPETQNVFEMKSQYGKEAIQSFKINGEELNDSNNQSAQKELCLKYFKVSPAIQKYLMGLNTSTLFTYLPANKRKELIMEMYPNDTRYAVGVHNKLKTELRNVSGAIKNQAKRLAEEQERIQSFNQLSEQDLEARINNLDQEIKKALVLQGELNKVVHPPEHDSLVQRFIKLTKETADYGMDRTIYSRQALDEHLERLDNSLTYNERRLDKVNATIAHISEALSGLNFEATDLGVLERNYEAQERLVKSTSDELASTKQLLDQQLHLGDWLTNLDFLSTIAKELSYYLSHVTVASTRELSLSSYRALQERFTELTDKGRGIKNALTENEHYLKHFDTTDDLECPDCKHKFKNGFDPKVVEARRMLVKQQQQQLEDLRNECKDLKSKLDNDLNWFESVSQLIQYVRRIDKDGVVMTLLKHYDIGMVPSDELMNVLGFLKRYQELQVLLKQQQAEYDIMRSRITALKSNDIVTLSQHFEEAELMAGEIQYSIRLLKKERADVLSAIDDEQSYDLKLNLLSELRQQVIDSFEQRSQYHLKRAVENKLDYLVPEKDALLAEFIRSKSNRSVIESIEQDLVYLQSREAKLKIVTNGLCPNKGYIGKLMLDFIKVLCGNWNAIIREVFSSPLYILPCQKADGDLNYKFPVINGDSDKSKADDVEECSGGESDIINFAFRRVLIRYISKHYPLFMDEVGTKLDAYHQDRFFDYIRRLSLSGEISQMFLVSHYSTQVGLFDYANVIALNSDNITLPKNVSDKAIIR